MSSPARDGSSSRYSSRASYCRVRAWATDIIEGGRILATSGWEEAMDARGSDAACRPTMASAAATAARVYPCARMEVVEVEVVVVEACG